MIPKFPIPMTLDVPVRAPYHFKTEKYKSVYQPGWSRFPGGNLYTEQVEVEDQISQVQLDNGVIESKISIYLPFCTSGMYYTLYTKDGKFYNHPNYTIHGYSDGCNWYVSLNEDGKLHSINGPAYIDGYLPDKINDSKYFFEGQELTEKEWFELPAVKMTEALR